MACKGYDGRWRAKDMTPIGWHGLAELGRGRTAMPAGITAIGWHGLAELGRGMTAMPAGMTPIGWHGLAELGRGRTAMPAGRTAGVTGGLSTRKN
jgi:hypothetical protein